MAANGTLSKLSDLHEEVEQGGRIVEVRGRGHGLVNEITEIALERTECYAPCPAYMVTLKSEGPADGRIPVFRAIVECLK